MKCSGCFREIEEGGKAYATVTGSIEKISCSTMLSAFIWIYNRGIQCFVMIAVLQCTISLPINGS